MTFPTRSTTATLAALALVTMSLVGCAPTDPAADSSSEDSASTDSSSTDSSETSSDTDAKGPRCEDNTSDVELFSDPAVSSAPEYGQVWGDGSELSITYDAFVEGELGYEISYVQDNGDVIPVTGGFFPDPVGTTFTSSDPYFDSTSEGYYGIVAVDLTSNVQFDGEKYTSDHVVLGNYCVILATSE